LTAQTEYPFQEVRKKDTVVIMLKSQAVKVNETLASQKNKIKQQQSEIDSLSKIKRKSDTVICRYTIIDTTKIVVVDSLKVPAHKTALAVPDENYLIYNWVDSTNRWELDPNSYQLERVVRRTRGDYVVVSSIFNFFATLLMFFHFSK